MKRVVVFDNDLEFRGQISGAVRASGAAFFGVFPSSSYVNAVLEELNPDVAFVNFALADGDTGTQTALSLAKAGCHVIICSDQNRIERELCEISHTYVQKPVTSDCLMEVLRPHL